MRKALHCWTGSRRREPKKQAGTESKITVLIHQLQANVGNYIFTDHLAAWFTKRDFGYQQNTGTFHRMQANLAAQYTSNQDFRRVRDRAIKESLDTHLARSS